MQDARPHPDYPLEVTPDEARAGFERLILFRLVDPDFVDQWTPVVGKVLGTSDVVIKIAGFIDGTAYSHRRYGSFASPFVRQRPEIPEWQPVGMPYGSPEQATLEAAIGASEMDGPEVIPAAAEIRRP
jgi:hypothetical protein